MNIPKEKRIRKYEITFLVPKALSDLELTKQKQELEELLKKHKAQVVKFENWGVRQLAYPIKKGTEKHTKAQYLHYVVNMEASNVKPLDKEIVLSSIAIRHLIVLANDIESTLKKE